MRYDAADQWLRTRLQMPTDLSSRGLAEVEPAIRATAFFSAKVAQGHILDKLREVSDAYTRGEMNLATARLTLKNAFGTRYEPGTPDDARLTKLASTARLDLILRQNARMAMAVGEYQQGMDPKMRRMFPYWRYLKSASASPRGAHRKYWGKVYRKDDPIWHRIFPPSEFNCKCSVEEVAADEVAPSDVEKPLLNMSALPPIPPSGFSFDPADALSRLDADCIHDDVLRCRIAQEMQSRFGCTTERDARTGHVVIQVHKNRFDNRVQGGAYYAGKNKKRFVDPVTGETREDIRNNKSTQDMYMERVEDYDQKRTESAAASRAYLELSEGEKHSLDAYTVGDAYALNRTMRYKKNMDGEQRRERIRLISALDRMPCYEGTVYRGMGVSQKTWAGIRQGLINGKNILQGFISTSWDREKAVEYAINGGEEVKVLLEIVDSKKGHFLGPVSCTPDDKEILYAPNQKFKVLGIKETGDIIHVKLKEM